MISSATAANGPDLALRAAYGPLFDKYGVDLVTPCGRPGLCGEAPPEIGDSCRTDGHICAAANTS
ncbi:hypothetical protein ACWD62_41415, partial [Streptomyces sp. NPDC005146]